MNRGVTAAIINWNSGSLLGPCVQSLLATREADAVVVIDNASGDDSLEAANAFRNQITIIRNSVNRGFAGAVNQAFEVAETPLVLILNPDVRTPCGAVDRLRTFLEKNTKVGAAGGYVNENYLPRSFPTVRGLVLENFGLAGSRRSAVRGREMRDLPVDQPAGAALIIRREAFESVGGFDEQFHPAWYEDVDFCIRLKTAGWQVYFVPQAEFIHEGGYSVDTLGFDRFAVAFYRNQLRYVRKHLKPASYWIVRSSLVFAMIVRMALRPAQARAYAHVLWGALGAWD